MARSRIVGRVLGVVGATIIAVGCTGCNGCNRSPGEAQAPRQQQDQWRGDQGVDQDVDAARRGLAPWPAIIDGREYPVVTRVAVGGPGDRMGVRPGDILLSYDGVDMSPMSSSNNILGATRQSAYNRGVQHVEVLMIPMGTAQVVRRTFPVGGTGAGVVFSAK